MKNEHEVTFARNLISRRVIDDLKNRSIMGMYFYVAITIAVLFVDGFYQRHYTFSLIFLCAMVGVAVFRIAHFYLFDKFDRLSRKVNRTVFFASVFATATAWGLGFAYCMVQPDESVTTKMLMLTSTAGLSAGGVVAFIPAWFVSVAYIFVMVTPAVIMMGLLRIDIPLVFLFVLYAVYMTIMATRGNREYWDALENEHLLRIRSQEIEKMSRKDSLTGLYNRLYFDEIFSMHFKTAARSGISLSIIIGDIDHFKPINDTYGHLAGDAYLESVARILAGTFQRETDFIARYGGEEFVILLLDQGKAETLRLVGEARLQIEKLRFQYYSHRIQTTMSFGVATAVPGLNEDKDKLFEKADNALYQAKNSGRNRVVVYEGENGS
ncbi:MAG: GGDEF domain-containing protein [Desulfosalsimonadaceae bacterium]